jgi:hypothetical protein
MRSRGCDFDDGHLEGTGTARVKSCFSHLALNIVVDVDFEVGMVDALLPKLRKVESSKVKVLFIGNLASTEFYQADFS